MPTLDDLTPRQRAIVDGLLAGKSNKQIAADLGIGSSTLHHHLARIGTHVGVTDRLQITVWAARQVMDPDPRPVLPDLIHPAMSPAFAELMLTTIATLQRDVEHVIVHNQPSCPRCERVTRAFAAAYHAEPQAA